MNKQQNNIQGEAWAKFFQNDESVSFNKKLFFLWGYLKFCVYETKPCELMK